MLQLRRRLLGLCLLPALLACLDSTLTLAAQSKEYWAGNYARVNEMSPTFHQLLAYHPLAFVAGEAGWILIFTGMILLMPQTLALIMSIAVTLGHTGGAASSLLFRYPYGYQVCIGLCLLVAVGLAVGIRWGWRAEPQFDAPVGLRLPCALRWAVIVALFGIAVYLYLWPRKP